EDGIRDKLVTGVQTCALPILVGASQADAALFVIAASNSPGRAEMTNSAASAWLAPTIMFFTKSRWPGKSIMVIKSLLVSKPTCEIGRASCRERVKLWFDGVQ